MNDQSFLLVADYLKEYKGELPVIGLRINPVVGAGDIAMMSTAAKQSKFGLPLLEDTQDRIVQIFKVIHFRLVVFAIRVGPDTYLSGYWITGFFYILILLQFFIIIQLGPVLRYVWPSVCP